MVRFPFRQLGLPINISGRLWYSFRSCDVVGMGPVMGLVCFRRGFQLECVFPGVDCISCNRHFRCSSFPSWLPLVRVLAWGVRFRFAEFKYFLFPTVFNWVCLSYYCNLCGVFHCGLRHQLDLIRFSFIFVSQLFRWSRPGFVVHGSIDQVSFSVNRRCCWSVVRCSCSLTTVPSCLVQYLYPAFYILAIVF